MQLIHTLDDLRQWRRSIREPVALVPTMGALHEGHLAHIDAARAHAPHVIVSIFVNPTQFGPGEDLGRYPRTLERDVAQAGERGATAVFAPSVDQMYPPDAIDTAIDVPPLTHQLEGEWRPGHFQGVCRVVAKLLHAVQPDLATFGRKDFQQLRVLQAMIRDLLMPVRVIEVPTVREADGLAMSSRNAYLDAAQRKHALGLYKALGQARAMVEADGESDPAHVEHAMRQALEAHDLWVDYAAIRHPQTLARLDAIEPALTGGVVALVAARLGPVRLIDNMLLGAE